MIRDERPACIEHVIVFGDGYEAALARAGSPSLPQLQEWDAFSIPYTSGTTGKPKGVVLPHRSRLMGFFGMAAEYGCYGPADSYLAIAPLCHGAGLCFAMACIYFGGTCEILPAFEPGIVVEKLSQVTCTFLVPTHFHAIFAMGDSVIEARAQASVEDHHQQRGSTAAAHQGDHRRRLGRRDPARDLWLDRGRHRDQSPPRISAHQAEMRGQALPLHAGADRRRRQQRGEARRDRRALLDLALSVQRILGKAGGNCGGRCATVGSRPAISPFATTRGSSTSSTARRT